MLPPGIESRLERRWELLEPLADVGSGRDPDRVPAPPPRAAGDATLDREPAPGWRAARGMAAATALRPARRERTIRRSGPTRLARPGHVAARRPRRPRRRTRWPSRTLRRGSVARRGSLLAPARRLEALGLVSWGGPTCAAIRWPTGRAGPIDGGRAGARAGVGARSDRRAAAGRRAPAPGRGRVGQDRCHPGRGRATLASGGGAIVLVPELTLVPQIADRLRARWGIGCRSSTRGCRPASATTNGSAWSTARPRW